MHDLLTFDLLISHCKGERKILWRILAAHLFYKMKILYGGRKVYVCFDSCLEIKMAPSGSVLLVSFSGSQLSFSLYLRFLTTVLPKSSAHWSPPAAFQERWFSGLLDDIHFMSGYSMCCSYQGNLSKYSFSDSPLQQSVGWGVSGSHSSVGWVSNNLTEAAENHLKILH